MKVEEQLVKGRGWLEYSVHPRYSPQSLIAEGAANSGIDLAFPDKTRPDTERDVLMPLPQIEPPTDDRYWQIQDAMEALQGARLTIAQPLLDGEIDRPPNCRGSCRGTVGQYVYVPVGASQLKN